MKTAFLLLFLALLPWPSPQLPSPAADPPTGTARVDGIVVDTITGRPIANVDVELSRVRGTENAPMDPEREQYFEDFLTGNGAFGAAPSSGVEPEIRYALTGGDGRFSFGDLPEGRYRIVASQGYARGDYYPAEYGQHDPRGRGSTFPLESGDTLSNMRLEMTLPGTIIGRVQDENGEPMSYVGILGLKVQYRDGRRVLNVEQSVYTNERGEYRLYWLGPGQYNVAAVVEDPWRRSVRSDPIPPGRRGPTDRASSPYVMSRILPTGEAIQEAYAVVYNGGVLDPGQARLLEIQPGSLVNADVPMNAGRTRVSHIRGVVLDGANGQPVSGASVRAVPRQWSPNTLILDGTTGADGSFDLVGAFPGEYDVFATAGSGPSGVSAALLTQLLNSGASIANISSLLGGGSTLTGYQSIRTTGADLDGVTITAVPGFNVPGRVVIEGEITAEAAAAITSMRVGVIRDPDQIGAPSGMAPVPQPEAAPGQPEPPRIVNGQVDERGLFPLYVFPGRYRFEVDGFPPDTYLKSLRLGTTEVLGGSVTLTRPPDSPLELVLGTDGGTMSGRVVDDQGNPVQNAMIALSPDPVALRQRPDLQKSVTSDEQGSFRIGNIPPGAYKLFAWRFVESGAWIDPDFRSLYETRGTLIYVEPGSQGQAELTVMDTP